MELGLGLRFVYTRFGSRLNGWRPGFGPGRVVSHLLRIVVFTLSSTIRVQRFKKRGYIAPYYINLPSFYVNP